MTPAEIKATREGLGLNITQMAALLGVDYDTYSQWERAGTSSPPWASPCFAGSPRAV